VAHPVLEDDRRREMETGTYPGESDKPSTQEAGEASTYPQADAPGKSVKAGFERAGAYVKDKVTAYRDGAIEQVSQDIVGYTQSQPMTALLIATGVGLVVGMLLNLGRR
jgi:ElaB/YqjD/DUF883 family membrane-anchored ribosome-binding protein